MLISLKEGNYQSISQFRKLRIRGKFINNIAGKYVMEIAKEFTPTSQTLFVKSVVFNLGPAADKHCEMQKLN